MSNERLFRAQIELNALLKLFSFTLNFLSQSFKSFIHNLISRLLLVKTFFLAPLIYFVLVLKFFYLIPIFVFMVHKLLYFPIHVVLRNNGHRVWTICKITIHVHICVFLHLFLGNIFLCLVPFSVVKFNLRVLVF